MNQKVRYFCIIILFIFAVLLIFAAIFAPLLIQNFVRTGLRDFVLVNSPESKGYHDWANPDTICPFYFINHLWNLTNPDAVLKGTAKPAYNSVGPFVYLRQKTKNEVAFERDGLMVSYKLHTDYIHQPSLSIGDPKQIKITNINPAYIGALYQAGSESRLSIGASGQVLKLIFDFMDARYVPRLLSDNAVTVLSKAVLDAREEVKRDLNYFLTVWANSTSPPDGSPVWNGLLLLTQSNISLHIAQELFNAKTRLSLLNNNVEATVVWQKAGENVTDALNEISTAFGLQATQLQLVVQWFRDVFKVVRVGPFLTTKYKVNAVSDLPYLQWGQGAITKSIKDLFPEEHFPRGPELAYLEIVGRLLHMPWEKAKYFLSGDFGVFDPTYLQEFLLDFEHAATDKIYQKWRLTYADALDGATYFLDFATVFSKPEIQRRIASGTTGLIVTRTADEWLWNSVDSLLLLLRPSRPSPALYQNSTDGNLTEVYTGSDDFAKIEKYYRWEGNTVLRDIWQSDFELNGFTEEGQFPPNGEFTSEVYPNNYIVFDDRLLRNVTMTHTWHTSFKGINLQRFELANETFFASNYYYQSIPGFANASSSQGAPIYLSYTDFFGHPEWQGKVDGMSPKWDECCPVIEVEPISGKVMRCHKRLQVNLYISDDDYKWFKDNTFGYQKVKTNIMFPIVKGHESADVPDNLASVFKENVYMAINAQSIIRYSMFGFSGLLLIAASGCTVVARRKTTTGYTTIQ